MAIRMLQNDSGTENMLYDSWGHGHHLKGKLEARNTMGSKNSLKRQARNNM